jgi:hypothetical protein
MHDRFTRFLTVLALGVLWGCAAAPEPAPSGAAAPAPPAAASPGAPPSGASTHVVTLRDDENLGKVWLAEGFRLAGYDGLIVTETQTDVPKINPDGIENLQWARGVVRDQLVAALQAAGLLGAVVTRDADVKPGGRVLQLETTIIEYEKGGGGARYWAGLYGAGQPVIKVRGRVLDGDRPVFVFETRRSGVTASARWLGGYRSDKAIQEEDIRDLAKAVAAFLGQSK